MGLISSVNEISSELSERAKESEKRQYERQLVQDYKRDLTKTIKDLVLYEFNFCSNIEKCYHDLMLSEKYIEEINKKMVNDFTIEIYIQELKDYKYKDIKKKVPKYKDFDLLNDIEEEYYKIVKNTYNRYKEKSKIQSDILENRLYNKLSRYIDDKGNKFGLDTIIQVLQKDNVKNAWIEEITEDKKEIKILKEKYSSILRKLYNNKKGIIKQTTTTRATKEKEKGNGLLTGVFLTGCFISGIKKGLK